MRLPSNATAPASCAFDFSVPYDALVGNRHDKMPWAGTLFFTYLIGVPVGYIGMAVLGWPLVANLRRVNRLTVGAVCIVAAIIGALTFMAWSIALTGKVHVSWHGRLDQAGLGLWMGLLAGLIFCGITGVPLRRHR